MKLLPMLVACAMLFVAACSNDDSADDGDAAGTATSAVPTIAANATPLPSTPTAVIPGATLVLIPPTAPATVGSPLLVTVAITGATNLAAFQFTFVFDETVLELVNITDAGFAGSTGRVPTCSRSRMERTTYFCVSGGAQPPGPSGDGDLALMEFRAIASGETQIALDRISATTPDATDIPLTAQPITITIP